MSVGGMAVLAREHVSGMAGEGHRIFNSLEETTIMYVLQIICISLDKLTLKNCLKKQYY